MQHHRVMSTRRFAVVYLSLQSVGATLWWVGLMVVPSTRRLFLPRSAPDEVLLAFALPDAVFFIAAGFAAAYGWAMNRPWARSVTCIHAGAAGYAGLYCWMSTWLADGDAWLAAVLMTPATVVPGWLAWRWNPSVE